MLEQIEGSLAVAETEVTASSAGDSGFYLGFYRVGRVVF
jgi:hypothetical protein